MFCSCPATPQPRLTRAEVSVVIGSSVKQHAMVFAAYAHLALPRPDLLASSLHTLLQKPQQHEQTPPAEEATAAARHVVDRQDSVQQFCRIKGVAFECKFMEARFAVLLSVHSQDINQGDHKPKCP